MRRLRPRSGRHLARPLLDRCDVHVRIPTLGLKQSINVATAGGVVLYELLRKYRQLRRGLGTGSGARRERGIIGP